MVVYAMLARLPDGMILCDCTDVREDDEQKRESKRLMKALARKFSSLATKRCVIRTPYHAVYASSSVNLLCLSLCLSNYSPVLAFSFNDQLIAEFVRAHAPRASEQVTVAHRPYVFLNFDPVIQSLRNRFNSSTSFQAKLNLVDLSEDLKRTPPMMVHPKDLISSFPKGTLKPLEPQTTSVCIGGTAPGAVTTFYQLEPLSCASLLLLGPCSILILLNLYRGINALSMSSIEEYDGPSPAHAFGFLMELGFQCFQVVFLLFMIPLRSFLGRITSVGIVITAVTLMDVRETMLTAIVIVLGILMGFFVIPARKYELKLPKHMI